MPVPDGVESVQLADEGIHGEKVQLVGDVMYDAALFYGAKAEQVSDVLERLDLVPKGYVLATIQRAENTDDPGRLGAIFEGFATSGQAIVLPLHPRTRGRLAACGLELPAKVRVIDPVGYLDMVMLEKNACLIATDSSGVQKEAFFYQVPCVTLRDETEWTELVVMGWNQVVPPTSAEAVADAIRARMEYSGTAGYAIWRWQCRRDHREKLDSTGLMVNTLFTNYFFLSKT